MNFIFNYFNSLDKLTMDYLMVDTLSSCTASTEKLQLHIHPQALQQFS